MDVILSTGAKALHLNLQPLGTKKYVETVVSTDFSPFFGTLFFSRDALSQDFRVHQPKIFVAQDDQPPKWVKPIAKLIGNP